MLRGVDEVATQQADVPAVTAIASAPPPLPASVAASRLLPVDAVQSVRFDRYMAAHGQMSGTLGLPRTSQYVLRDPATDAEGR
jgi:hypothetical protein